jgi:hypothetical protein
VSSEPLAALVSRSVAAMKMRLQSKDEPTQYGYGGKHSGNRVTEH